jgi:hypothetical protein
MMIQQRIKNEKINGETVSPATHGSSVTALLPQADTTL